MTTKIKIDLANGLLEVEGSEEFVRSVYDDYKDKLASEPGGRETPPPLPLTQNAERSNGGTRKAPKKHAQPAAPQGAAPKTNLKQASSIKTLDLTKGPGGRLRDFYDQFEVKTNLERNLIFIYFLQHKMGIEQGITQNHVFTCYRDIPGIKVPGALRQSLLDTDKDRDWIDAANADNLKVHVHGLNHLEHDMPRKKAG